MSDNTKAGDLPLDPPDDGELDEFRLNEADSDEYLAELAELDELPAEPVKRAGVDESIEGEPADAGASELDELEEGAGS